MIARLDSGRIDVCNLRPVSVKQFTADRYRICLVDARQRHIMFIRHLAHAFQIRNIRFQQILCQCLVIAQAVRHSFSLGEYDIIAFVSQCIGRFDSSHQTCIENQIVQFHRQRRCEVLQFHGVGDLGAAHICADTEQ